MAYLFGIRDAKIALWLSSGAYGSLYDLPAVNRIEYNQTLSEGQLEGDDEIVDSYAKIIGVEGRVVFGENTTVRPELMQILLGTTNTSSGSKERMKLGATNPNYFGLAWKVVTSESGAEDHFLVYKARINNVSYSAQYNGYVVPEISFRGVADASYVMEIVQDQALNTALVMPLTF